MILEGALLPARPYIRLVHATTRGRRPLCVGLAPRRGRLPAGPAGGPACPAYILYLTCRLPKVDLSVTEVVYTTKVVYLPVLINPGSQFDS